MNQMRTALELKTPLSLVRLVRGKDAAVGDHERPGSGLGLAICRSIVAMHGGRICAANIAGGTGLRVMLDIPA